MRILYKPRNNNMYRSLTKWRIGVADEMDGNALEIEYQIIILLK